MNEAEEQEDVTEFEEETSPPPRSGASRAPSASKAPQPEKGNATLKLVIGCALTMLIGMIVLKFDILTKSAAMTAVAVQVLAFIVYFMTSGIAAGYEQSTKVKGRDALGPERRAMRRRTAIRFFTCLMLAFLGAASFQRYGILGYPPPWKITDPARAQFNVAQFSFTDYRSTAELENAARKLLPVGTPKAAVDRLLFTTAHGTVKLYDQGAGWKTFSYGYANGASRGFLTDVLAWMMGSAEADRLWFVFVKFDANNKVIGISASVQVDRSGALPFTQLTPSGEVAPYTAPAGL